MDINVLIIFFCNKRYLKKIKALYFKLLRTRDGPWPNPSILLIRSWIPQARVLLTKPIEIFFDPKGKKLKNLRFLGEIFKTQNHRWLTWPRPTWATKNSPNLSQKLLTQTHHYSEQFVMILIHVSVQNTSLPLGLCKFLELKTLILCNIL